MHRNIYTGRSRSPTNFQNTSKVGQENSIEDTEEPHGQGEL